MNDDNPNALKWIKNVKSITTEELSKQHGIGQIIHFGYKL